MNIAPQFLQCSGEVVFPEHRQAIEQAFGRPLFNVYSSSEHLIMGMSRGGGEDMILFEENFVFEQNEDHSLVTNLYNYTLPLIRYRMNDRLIPAEKPESDRHPYRRIKEIVGRAEGGDLVFRTPDGREERITSFAFGSLLLEKRRAHPVPCRQRHLPTRPRARARPRRGPGRGSGERRAHAKLRDLFASRALHHVEIPVRAVDFIEPDPTTGKVRAVVTIGAGNAAQRHHRANAQAA